MSQQTGVNESYEYPVHFRCPLCGSRAIARIQWGRPTYTEKLRAELDAGTAVLGGCMMAYDSTRWRCRSCGHEFGDMGNRILEFIAQGKKVPDYVCAYDRALNNRKELGESKVCGCLWCESIYSPREILEWAPDDLGSTAVCPRCGHDSVLGSASGYPVTVEFLQMMHGFWIDGK